MEEGVYAHNCLDQGDRTCFSGSNDMLYVVFLTSSEGILTGTKCKL